MHKTTNSQTKTISKVPEPKTINVGRCFKLVLICSARHSLGAQGIKKGPSALHLRISCIKENSDLNSSLCVRTWRPASLTIRLCFTHIVKKTPRMSKRFTEQSAPLSRTLGGLLLDYTLYGFQRSNKTRTSFGVGLQAPQTQLIIDSGLHTFEGTAITQWQSSCLLAEGCRLNSQRLQVGMGDHPA